ncbi:MAG: alpha/beta fold hydrolase [Rubrobacter sp.]|nr:alpha/beta fold hydrolase [Rubrobacter sp.]
MTKTPGNTPGKGGALAYLEAGAGDRAAVLIHGNFAGKSWWRELLADPPTGIRLTAPDLSGFGESRAGPDFAPSIPRYARSLAGFLDASDIERPVLVGHSFGGAVAVQLALSDPERFPAMFLLSPAPLTGLHTPRYVYPRLKSYRHDHRGLRRALRRTMITRVPPYLDDLVYEAQMMHPANFTGNARELSAWDVSTKVRYFENPVLVISGNRDTLVSSSSARAIAHAFPRGKYFDLGSVGHSPHIEAPHLTRSLLSQLVEVALGG